MKTLLIDTSCLMHRAKSGFSLGDHSVTFNFFRGLKSLVEILKPNKVICVLDGSPTARLSSYAEYKGTRKIDPADEKAVSDNKKFTAQKREIEEILKMMPVTLIRHPNHEADDVIAALADENSIVVSTDKDFYQLDESVKIYNPVKKQFVASQDELFKKLYAPARGYQYVEYKAFTGDGSDNIHGIAGVGEKKAFKLVHSKILMNEFFANSSNEVKEHWSKNVSLIRFETVNLDECTGNVCITPDWNSVRNKFDEYLFKSVTNDDAWRKFVKTFTLQAAR
jgi:DNA polymerase-1